MSNYPDNHFLAGVINAIDEVKADKINVPKIYFDDREHWEASVDPSEANAIYIYTDYYTDEESNLQIQGVKIGDGEQTVEELPFLDTLYMDHINDMSIHVSQGDRNAWDNNVSASVQGENAIFRTRYES